MTKFSKRLAENSTVIMKTTLVLLLSLLWATPALADISPRGCTGSGLGINFYTNFSQAKIGDVISYSIVIFNGASDGPVFCDATGIKASLSTPDGVNHPIGLRRTSLASGESDSYPNAVTYAARVSDIKSDGTLSAAASDTGIIHQNITNGQGGGNQKLNVLVLNSLRIINQIVGKKSYLAKVSDFIVHVKSAGVDVGGSPAQGTSAPGTLFSLVSGAYAVSEGANNSYSQSFSGDCDSAGILVLSGGSEKTCIIMNSDSVSGALAFGVPGFPNTGFVLPPVIRVTLVATPSKLSGRGKITYSNIVDNPGAIALTNIRVNDDKCAPVNYHSGDTNGDLKLDVNEIWTYTCQTNLLSTSTNTARAEGEANGITARNITTATVRVSPPR